MHLSDMEHLPVSCPSYVSLSLRCLILSTSHRCSVFDDCCGTGTHLPGFLEMADALPVKLVFLLSLTCLLERKVTLKLNQTESQRSACSHVFPVATQKHHPVLPVKGGNCDSEESSKD